MTDRRKSLSEKLSFSNLRSKFTPKRNDHGARSPSNLYQEEEENGLIPRLRQSSSRSSLRSLTRENTRRNSQTSTSSLRSARSGWSISSFGFRVQIDRPGNNGRARSNTVAVDSEGRPYRSSRGFYGDGEWVYVPRRRGSALVSHPTEAMSESRPAVEEVEEQRPASPNGSEASDDTIRQHPSVPELHSTPQTPESPRRVRSHGSHDGHFCTVHPNHRALPTQRSGSPHPANRPSLARERLTRHHHSEPELRSRARAQEGPSSRPTPERSFRSPMPGSSSTMPLHPALRRDSSQVHHATAGPSSHPDGPPPDRPLRRKAAVHFREPTVAEEPDYREAIPEVTRTARQSLMWQVGAEMCNRVAQEETRRAATPEPERRPLTPEPERSPSTPQRRPSRRRFEGRDGFFLR